MVSISNLNESDSYYHLIRKFSRIKKTLFETSFSHWRVTHKKRALRPYNSVVRRPQAPQKEGFSAEFAHLALQVVLDSHFAQQLNLSLQKINVLFGVV